MSKTSENIESSRNVLIIGCGDLGLQLATLIHTKGYQCTGLNRSQKQFPDYLSSLQGDICHLETAQQLLGENKYPWDYIVITLVPSERSDAGYRDSYVQGVENTLKALERTPHKPKLVLFASSTAVYGQSSGELIDEQSETVPSMFNGKRLLESEELLKDSTIPSVSLRFGGIYGPGRTRALSNALRRVKQREFSASGNIANRIHSFDCARVLAHFIERAEQQHPIADTYLCVDRAPSLDTDVEQWLCDQLGVDYPAVEIEQTRGNKFGCNQQLLKSGFEFHFSSFREGYLKLLDDISHES